MSITNLYFSNQRIISPNLVIGGDSSEEENNI
jgi:hypothetical protein